ncbi:MAG: tripartite tricarboxylate transporter substrate binding protein [Betaproteobacteria bacterium]|nr:tripartite tricarboxylate transporter substrate binding protein [Betaproteobacteria bacterium]
MGQGNQHRRRQGGTVKVVIAFLLAFAAGLAQAQPWPSRQIRYIVPFPPGAFNDTLARTVAAELPKAIGQAVVVDNRPGGNSIIGTEAAAKSAPDGYTLFGAALPFSVIQSLYKTSFEVTRDFAPITLAGFSANLLVAHPSFPPNSVAELIKYATANPGRVNYGSSGNGTSVHLSMELLKSMTRTFMVHIPYRGSAPVVTDLIAGQLDVMFDNVPNVIQHVRSGRMKALAVSTSSRSALAPEVPTVAEAGVPGYELSVWFGVLAPAGTPREIVGRLNSEIVKILTSADVKERFAKQGVEVQTGTPEQFSEFLKSEVARWAKVIKDAGIKAD